MTTNALADGQHTFEVRATDVAGNPGPPASVAFAIDTSSSGNPPDGGTAPETVLNKGPKARLVTRAVTKTVKFLFSSPSQGAQFECALQKTRKSRKPPPPKFGPCASPKTYKKKPGTYTFQVRAVAGGLTDATPAKMTFTIVAAVAP